MTDANANANQPSTVKSYIDSADAAVMNAISSVTGNGVDKRAAEEKRADAHAEHEASKLGAKAGPFNLSTAGVTVDNEDRTGGKKDQVVGSGKEFVGNVVGSRDLQAEGRRQNEEGQGREAAGQVKDYVGGAVDRVTGTIGTAVSGLTGNSQAKGTSPPPTAFALV